MGLVGNISPYSNDFYEARKEGMYFRNGGSAMLGAWFESNNNKAYSINPEIYYRHFFDFYNAQGLDLNLGQNWRVNQRFSLRLNTNTQLRWNNIGFSSFSSTAEPVFARRELRTIETSLRSKYSFTNRMGMTLVGRHYVRAVRNNQLYDLQANGRLSPNLLNPAVNDRTVNFFNIDLVYTWQIAQGSFVNIVWKSAIFASKGGHQFSYLDNFRNTLQENQNNSLSFRMIYFIDYAATKKSFKRS
jgi:hypothetical protein